MSSPSSMTFKGPPLPPLPLSDLLTWIFADPTYPEDKPIYISANDPTRHLTRRDVQNLLHALIAGWHSVGLQPGDCVLIHSFNDILYPVLVLSIIGAGGIYTGSNPTSTAAELSHHITSSSVRFIVTEPELLPTVVSSTLIPTSRIFIFTPLSTQTVPSGYQSWRTLLAHGSRPWRIFASPASDSRTTTACRLFSSGTTGAPKPANLSHANMVAQHTAVWVLGDAGVDYPAIHVISLPMFHAAAAGLAHFSLLKSGQTGYVMRRFELRLYLDTVREKGVTDLGAVPAMVQMLMTAGGRREDFVRVKRVIVGAAPLGREVQERFRRLLLRQETKVVQCWGMTETCCVATMFGYPEGDETGSVGRLIAGLEAKLVDEKGRNITAYDTLGEMVLRGPTIFQGYHHKRQNEMKDVDVDEEGWYHTGDMMYVAKETGKWYITARKKELIKVRGFQVSPGEVEAVVLLVRGVKDAAVVGVGDEEWVRAYVVADQKTVTEEMVVQAVKKKLASYKRITGGVRFVEAIPRNAGGKILRNTLKKWALEEDERMSKL